ncbi:MAG: outer membrane beta-barrel protein [Chitinophagales bacterium]|nr:outer membrane beta-barrel protein [Bacteroidota bacterium]
MKKMKLMVAAIACFIMLSNFAKAQDFTPGSLTFSAGYGFPSIAKTTFKLVEGDNINSSFYGPFYGKAEFALNETVGFGVNFAYASGSATYLTQDNEIDTLFYNSGVNYKAFSILARFNFHFGNSDRFDPYAGIGLGYRNNNYSYTGGDPDSQPSDINGFFHMGADLTIGARMYLTENIGIYGEVGVAKTPIQVGLVIKL